MKQHHLFVFCFLVVCLFNSCVEEITINNQPTADFLVVDGILNSGENADPSDLVVRLSTSTPTSTLNTPLPKANVEVLVNDRDVYPLVEQEAGAYYLLNKTIFKVGNTYKLRFQANGQSYESTAETLVDSTAFVKTYTEVNSPGSTEKAFEVFVDVNDPPQKKNFYRWSIIQWEQLAYCLYCYKPSKSAEYCYEDITPTDYRLLSRNPSCDGDCYAILRSSVNNAISDIFFDGKSLIKKPIGYIPFIFSTGCLVEVQQSSAYCLKYWTEYLSLRTQNR